MCAIVELSAEHLVELLIGSLQLGFAATRCAFLFRNLLRLYRL